MSSKNCKKQDSSLSQKVLIGVGVVVVGGLGYLLRKQYSQSNTKPKKKKSKKQSKQKQKRPDLSNSGTSQEDQQGKEEQLGQQGKETTTTTTITTTTTTLHSTQEEGEAKEKEQQPKQNEPNGPADKGNPTKTQKEDSDTGGDTDDDSDGGVNLTDIPVNAIPPMGGEDSCSKETLCNVFRDILVGLDEVVLSMAQEEAEYRQKGQPPPPELLESFNTRYQQTMMVVHQNALHKYNTTDRATEIAMSKYEKDPEFMELSNRLQAFNRALSGMPPELDQKMLERLPSDLTVDRLVQCMEAIMEGSTKCRQQAKERVKGETPTDEKISKEKFTKYFEAGMALVWQDIHAKFSIDKEILEIAVQKYMQEPQLQTVLLELRERNLRENDEY